MKLLRTLPCWVPVIAGLVPGGVGLAIDRRVVDVRRSNDAPFPPSAGAPRSITVITDEGTFRPNLAIHREGQPYTAAHTWVLFEGVAGNPPLRVELGRSDANIHVAQHKGDLSQVDLGDGDHADPGVKRRRVVLATKTTLSNRQIWNPQRSSQAAPTPSWVEYLWRVKRRLIGAPALANGLYPYVNPSFRTSPEFAMTLLANIDVASQGALFPGGPQRNADVRALTRQLAGNQKWELERERTGGAPATSRSTDRLIFHTALDQIQGGLQQYIAVYVFDMTDAAEQKELVLGSLLHYAGEYPPGGT